MSDDARINKLGRYSKESDRLILEEHSAGCGGIILRWRDPNEGVPIRIQAAAAVQPDFFLDGAALPSVRFIAKPGPHLLAIRLTLRHREPRWFSTLGYVDVGPQDEGYDELIPGLSSGDQGWVFRVAGESEFVTTQDSLEWADPLHDDSAWETPDETELPQDNSGYEHWRYQLLTRRGAKVFEVPDVQELWFRKRFVLARGPK
ncbi:MAG: hypothetical protein ACR2NZ_15845 [Rubripirellula sp.]